MGWEVMKASEIMARVVEIIVAEFAIAQEAVTPEADFIQDLGFDSLGAVELKMRFEEEFDIEIPDEDAEEIATVENAVQYIADFFVYRNMEAQE